jgi:hypothetical protein
MVTSACLPGTDLIGAGNKIQGAQRLGEGCDHPPAGVGRFQPKSVRFGQSGEILRQVSFQGKKNLPVRLWVPETGQGYAVGTDQVAISSLRCGLQLPGKSEHLRTCCCFDDQTIARGDHGDAWCLAVFFQDLAGESQGAAVKVQRHAGWDGQAGGAVYQRLVKGEVQRDVVFRTARAGIGGLDHGGDQSEQNGEDKGREYEVMFHGSKQYVGVKRNIFGSCVPGMLIARQVWTGFLSK